MASTSGHSQEYFNKEAASYDAKYEKNLQRLLEEIRARLDFIGADWVEEEEEGEEEDDDGNESRQGNSEKAHKKAVRLLDYACGTGLVSRALAPYTTQCVGIDLSGNMVAAYNARSENQGLSASEMHAYQGNLCVPDEPSPPAFASPEFFGFDVAAVGLGFHHFDDPALAARRLAERLRSGGVLVIIDFLPHDKPDPSHVAASSIAHNGFSKEQIRRIYAEAGVGKDFAIEKVADVFNLAAENKPEMRRTVFIARGTKA